MQSCDDSLKDCEKRNEYKERKDAAVDPWQHRSHNMKCLSCMWFVPKLSPLPKRRLR